MARHELFDWAVSQAEAAANLPPVAIHQSSYPKNSGGGGCDICADGVVCIHGQQIIRARPFTVAFERYVDGEMDTAPISQALEEIRSDPSMRLEFEVAWAIVWGGHTDLDILHAVLGRPHGFDSAVTRGLTLLREKTLLAVQKRLTETSQRRETAGAAQQARAEDNPKPKKRGRVMV